MAKFLFALIGCSIYDTRSRSASNYLNYLQCLCSFNAAPGTGAAMRSGAARLSIMSCEERNELKKEIRECLGPIGLNLKTLHKMKKLDNLVCEVNVSGIIAVPSRRDVCGLPRS